MDTHYSAMFWYFRIYWGGGGSSGDGGGGSFLVESQTAKTRKYVTREHVNAWQVFQKCAPNVCTFF